MKIIINSDFIRWISLAMVIIGIPIEVRFHDPISYWMIVAGFVLNLFVTLQDFYFKKTK